MGWCSGDRLLGSVWSNIRLHIPKEARVEVLKRMIGEFENFDMDCWDCIEGFPEGKKAIRELHPDWNWSDDYGS